MVTDVFLFQTNINTIFKQIHVKKSSSPIQCWVSNPRPLEYESPPITTRPGFSVLLGISLPMLVLNVLFQHAYFKSEGSNPVKTEFQNNFNSNKTVLQFFSKMVFKFAKKPICCIFCRYANSLSFIYEAINWNSSNKFLPRRRHYHILNI